MAFLGYIIALAGVFLIVVGAYGAARGVIAERGAGMADAESTLATVLKEIPALLDALGRAPKWLSAVVVGIVLVWTGVRLSANAWPFA